MNPSIRKGTRRSPGVIRAVSAAILAAAATIALSSPASAASQDYRFDVAQVAPAGPGRSDVTIGLVRTIDGTVVTGADLRADSAVGTMTERAGYRRFRVETPTAGPHTLQVTAKVPGPTRIERTFNSSVKYWQTRTIRGADKVVTSMVTLGVN